jgi:hypothetical protein
VAINIGELDGTAFILMGMNAAMCIVNIELMSLCFIK